MTSKARARVRNRKYGTARHKRARLELGALVAAGLAVCGRCGGPIEPGELFDVGHDDYDPSILRPEHASCNRGAPHRNIASRQW